jgi:hypothetical protein
MQHSLSSKFEDLSAQMKTHQTEHALYRNLSVRLIFLGTAGLSALVYATGAIWLLVDGMDVGALVAMSTRIGSNKFRVLTLFFIVSCYNLADVLKFPLF